MTGPRLVLRLSLIERTEFQAAAARAGLVEADAARLALATWARSKPAAVAGAGSAPAGELRIEREVDPLTGRPA